MRCWQAANQKTSHQSGARTDEAAVSTALDELKDLGLVAEVSGSRVVRFAHHLEKAPAVPTQAGALLTVLLLRGLQTAGNCASTATACMLLPTFSVEAFLEELAGRPGRAGR